MSDIVKVSKFLSFILRHSPESIGIVLDEHGWADISEIIQKSSLNLNFEIIEKTVQENNKKRFSLSPDRKKIRASQGHTIQTDVELKKEIPPEFLYHGTAEKHLELILKEGLKPMKRLHVHLSKDIETALSVGRRHGKPSVLKIHSGRMYEDGFVFYLSENSVWLTDSVPVQYIERISTAFP
ncbi:MAG TPA: RNA 2'-phosphotransferase [Leptospiraceae bacterium]|nr:RNA 2'-phosphotransferase [Leptospiraceae bacterium]HMY69571.1 RNA 2'-phosphotransferase [Leptospiraceae bacterium]HNF17156.1 RNA 2'-phosphotransferase [Leptospiraceae bacterium]HNH09723.1 RNA 2'-phosphotransferase [Leptospiraceae bacterium]HNM04309.1 RNA 2'-phosphotransferase [Leptospiraceae bacterium]